MFGGMRLTVFRWRTSHPECHTRGEDIRQFRFWRSISADQFGCHHSTLCSLSQSCFTDPLEQSYKKKKKLNAALFIARICRTTGTRQNQFQNRCENSSCILKHYCYEARLTGKECTTTLITVRRTHMSLSTPKISPVHEILLPVHIPLPNIFTSGSLRDPLLALHQSFYKSREEADNTSTSFICLGPAVDDVHFPVDQLFHPKLRRLPSYTHLYFIPR